MGHNSVVSGHPKSTGIPQVDELSTGRPNLGCHSMVLELSYTISCSVLGMGLGYAVVVWCLVMIT